MVKHIAEEVGLLDNLRSVTAAIRRPGIQIFIVRIGAGSRRLRKLGHLCSYQIASGKMQTFAKGS